MLRNNALTGFVASDLNAYPTAGEWVTSPYDQQSPAETAAERAMLTKEGFRGGVVESLSGSSTNDGLSIVARFPSAAAARSALAYYTADQQKPSVQASDGRYASFKVAGVPGAVGFSVGGAGGGINIAFAQGDYYYLVGREGGSRADIDGLKGAAVGLYRQVRGPVAVLASLRPYLITGNEETGYRIQGAPRGYLNAASYAAFATNTTASALKRAGFRQALVENTGAGQAAGLSFVQEYATASDAEREQPVLLSDDLNGQPARFSVSGVPGSDGFGLPSPGQGQQGDANVLFREGRCLLLVGDESEQHDFRAAVITGVRAIYARTHGHGACGA